jgi:hypothetical protein
MNAHTRLLEKPNKILETMVQVKARRMMGLRPKRSDALPQAMPVRHWEREKVADMRPAHFATLSSRTWKDWIISGCGWVSKSRT